MSDELLDVITEAAKRAFAELGADFRNLSWVAYAHSVDAHEDLPLAA